MKTLHLSALTLLTLTGVFSDSSEWRVNYSEPICAVRGSSVSISCTYSYPGPVHEVQRVLWCLYPQNNCKYPPYVYDSDSSTASGGFEFVGDKKSNCTLLIRNVQVNNSGEYSFRFITDISKGKWTGAPGATLEVSALELWMSSSSGDRTLKEGDSVNLTCAVNCTPSSPQFVWFKNGECLHESGSILHLLTLTVGDSGNYSCALKPDESVRSEPVQLNIGAGSWSWFTVLVVVGVMLVFLNMAIVVVIYKRKTSNAQEELNRGSSKINQTEESTRGEQTQHLPNQASPATETLPQETDVTYATVNITQKRKKRTSHTVQQGVEDSVIYSDIATKPIQ
ncbi:carcinoembryonic antigen-related cell adhesion molecule 1-like isoform X2 [Hoplias malabaricus]|uniref:carcinoembryonic antigen-related cell adhesion molecule 1-like isoform X2 n=1 Tax=Hoplias malabaricus TaxID=27720 RepID=UPI00346379DD